MFKVKGFTLLELMIVVAIIGIFLAVIIGPFVAGGNKDYAEKEAIEFATKVYQMQGATAQCMNKDTDNNGYVGCTIGGTVAGKRNIAGIECATRWSQNEGCKVVPMLPTINFNN